MIRSVTWPRTSTRFRTAARLRSCRILAPGLRQGAGPGALLWALALLVPLGGCETPPALRPPPELELEGRSVTLAPGTEILEVRLHATATRQIDPDSVSGRPGDVVRFVAADALTHVVAFDEASLGPEQRAFLATKQQQRSPPLLSAGSTWVVSLEDAPAGSYPFVCLTHGGKGTLFVVAPD
jgi:plastocyanin